MHLSDGILSAPVLIGGGALAAAGVWAGLRTLRDEDIPRAGLLTSAFFVASLIHVPIGPVSIHLVLNGLMGLLLGRAAFPAVLVGLLLQAVLFRHGGITVLGVNTLIMAGPAWIVGCTLRPLLSGAPTLRRVGLVGVGAGAAGIAMGSILAAGALALTGRNFFGVAGLFLMTHIPLMLVEGLITGSLVTGLWRLKPEWVQAPKEDR